MNGSAFTAEAFRQFFHFLEKQLDITVKTISAFENAA